MTEFFRSAATYGVYMFTLFFAVQMFASRRAARSRNWIRLAAVVASMAALAFALAPLGGLLSEVMATDLLNYVVMSLSVVLFVPVLYRERGGRLIYCVCTGVFVRQGYAKLVMPFALLFGISSDSWWYFLLHIAIVEVIYTLVYVGLARRISLDDTFRPNRQTVVLAFILSFILFASYLEPVLSRVDMTVTVVFCVAESLCCLLVLFVHYWIYVFSRRLAQEETENRLRAERLRQFENLRAVIDVINVKVHDMKYAGQNRAPAQDITDILEEYGLFVRTGNDVLDAVLTERNLFLHGKGIALTCMLDGGGELLSFLSAEDVAALFGNALDNAAEYLSRFDDAEKKFVRIVGRETDGFVMLRIENYYEGGATFGGDGLPRTTKEDTDYHGFGTKSIRRIAEKYGGGVVMKTEDSLFKVHLLFPVRR